MTVQNNVAALPWYVRFRDVGPRTGALPSEG